MFMVYVDFETYYNTKTKYSLTHMSTEDYVLDPQFTINGMAIAIDQGKTRFIPPDKVARAISIIDWSQAIVVCHNTRFDGLILSYHFGVDPLMWSCTMSMANQHIRPFTGRVSLEACGQFMFGIGKRKGVLEDANGLYYDDIADKKAYADYAVQDVELMRKLERNMVIRTSTTDHFMLDMFLRMYLEPHLLLDKKLLQQSLNDEIVRRDQVMSRTGLTKTALRSNTQFAKALEDMGVEVPMKPSPTGKCYIPAVAKSDEGFKALLNGEAGEDVAILCEGRLAAKSALVQTRTERLLDIAEKGRPLRVPLNYFGAHTGRASGAEKINLQNLTRGSELRKAIVAPPGYKIVAADASQIEARALAFYAGEFSLVEAFADGKDVYSVFASELYGHKVNKEDHPDERFVGKTAILGLGYGCGAKRFEAMLNYSNIYGEDADDIVKTYRRLYPKIRKFWKRGEKAIRAMADGTKMDIGPFTTGDSYVQCANGTKLHYPDLRYDHEEGWSFGGDKNRRKLYGAKFIENLIQACTRIMVIQAARRVQVRYPHWKYVFMVHDENVFLVPEDEAEEALSVLIHEMSRPPDWGIGLPLAAEGGYADSYGDIEK